jgi:hypothetical protein
VLFRSKSGTAEPMATYNGTGQTASYADPALQHPTTLLNVHPGPNGERSVLKWTSPAAATYQINGRFEGLHTTTTDVMIVHRPAPARLFSADVDRAASAGATPFLIENVTVQAGDAIDFSVGWGSNARHHKDSTGVAATITRTDITPNVSYGAVPGFSASSNPAGAWSYGFSWCSDAMTSYASANNAYGSVLQTWSPASNGAPPMITRNPTTETQTYSTVSQPPDVLNLHPGPNGERSVLRWIAPAAGVYRIEGTLQPLDDTITDVTITHRGVPVTVFTGAISGFGTQAPFSFVRPVRVGDTIELSVGVGSNGTYFSDSTGVAAIITRQ